MVVLDRLQSIGFTEDRHDQTMLTSTYRVMKSSQSEAAVEVIREVVSEWTELVLEVGIRGEAIARGGRQGKGIEYLLVMNPVPVVVTLCTESWKEIRGEVIQT